MSILVWLLFQFYFSHEPKLQNRLWSPDMAVVGVWKGGVQRNVPTEADLANQMSVSRPEIF